MIEKKEVDCNRLFNELFPGSKKTAGSVLKETAEQIAQVKWERDEIERTYKPKIFDDWPLCIYYWNLEKRTKTETAHLGFFREEEVPINLSQEIFFPCHFGGERYGQVKSSFSYFRDFKTGESEINQFYGLAGFAGGESRVAAVAIERQVSQRGNWIVGWIFLRDSEGFCLAVTQGGRVFTINTKKSLREIPKLEVLREPGVENLKQVGVGTRFVDNSQEVQFCVYADDWGINLRMNKSLRPNFDKLIVASCFNEVSRPVTGNTISLACPLYSKMN